MRKSTVFLSAATAAALVAGVGIAAAPAQAKVTSQVSGSTTITILPKVYSQFSAGVQVQAFPPATSTNPAGTQAIHFPVTTPLKPGAVANTGVMTIGALLNRIDLSLPILEYSSTKGRTTGQITFKDEYASLTSDRFALFKVTGMSLKVTKGKATKSGATWKRTDRQWITGKVAIVDNPKTVDSLNTYIGTTLFTPGMEFGTLDSNVTTTITCKTRRECL